MQTGMECHVTNAATLEKNGIAQFMVISFATQVSTRWAWASFGFLGADSLLRPFISLQGGAEIDATMTLTSAPMRVRVETEGHAPT